MTIQIKYEELAAKLCQITEQRKKVEAIREERTRPLREQLKVELSALLEEYNNIIQTESTFRQEMAKLYGEAKALREAAYKEACAAQEAGDMDGVMEASLRANDLAITTNANVFFRTSKQIEILDEALVPREYLMVDVNKLESAEGEVPGVRVFEKPVVVVKL